MANNKLSSHNAVKNSNKVKKTVGKQIAGSTREQAQLDSFEAGVKRRMQDRFKFMSGKNAIRNNQQLHNLDKQRQVTRAKLSRLQELV